MNPKIRGSVVLITVLIFLLPISCSQENKQFGVIYRNPQVMNVDYSFELVPDPEKIDRSKDLKLWMPIPREWDSQKTVKIISVEPPSHAGYQDPEHGNLMLFWISARSLKGFPTKWISNSGWKVVRFTPKWILSE